MENRFSEIVKNKTSEELLEMVYQFHVWDNLMLVEVEKELSQRQLLPNDIKILKQELIVAEQEKLAKGKEASLAGQIFGWLGVLGLVGLVIGYNYAFSKNKSKYTGEVFYKYDEASRQNGSYIFYTSLSIFILYFFYKVITMNGGSI